MGTYNLVLKINGLSVDQSPYSITIAAGATTIAAQSTITTINSAYSAGDTILFLIEAKDLNGNLRSASTAETFTVAFTVNSVATSVTPTSNTNGTYTVSHMFTTSGTYTLSVQFGGTDLSGTPVNNIEVSVGTVQAVNSLLSTSSASITAGQTTNFRITPKDAQSNIAYATNERFAFLI